MPPRLRVGVLCEGCDRPFEIQPCCIRSFCSRACYDESRQFTPERFWVRVDKRGPDECWPWTGGMDSGDGYGRAYDGVRTRQAHDVAWELTHKRKIRRGKLVRHTCDNRPCCNPKHLLEGTVRDNVRDCIARGRDRKPYRDFDVPLHRRPIGDRNGMRTHPEAVLRGERSPMSKLTQRTVAAIRRIRARTGLSYPKLAQRFRVSTSQVFRIVRQESWASARRNAK